MKISKLFLMNTFFVLFATLLGACSAGGGDGLSPDLQTFVYSKGDLSKAVFDNDLAKVESLIAAGAPVSENLGGSTTMVTPLMIAIFLERDPVIVEKLLMAGASPADSFMGYTTLDVALIRESTSVYDLLKGAL